MSVYFVAQIKIHDNDEYEKYLAGVDDVFARYNGEYLAVDDSPRVMEGKWEYTKMVLIRFENESDLLRWYESPEYQEILRHRLQGAQCDTVLVKGK